MEIAIIIIMNVFTKQIIIAAILIDILHENV